MSEHEHKPHELLVRDLHVHYGKICALQDVSFSASCHRGLALVGPNGGGKSTLLRAIAGLLPHISGQILWQGNPVAKYRYEIAYLPQREEIDWNFPITVGGLVEMGRYPHVGLMGRFTKVDQDAVDTALEYVGIQNLRDRHISQLSGGQLQRAYLARALAQQPHIFLLDEPFTGLDFEARERLHGLLKGLTEQGRLMIASHHDLSTLEKCFDDVLVLNQRKLAFGPVAEVRGNIVGLLEGAPIS